MDEDEHSRAWDDFRAKLPEPLAAWMPDAGPAQLPDVVALGEVELGPRQLLPVLREQVKLQPSGQMQGRAEDARCGFVANAWRQVVYRQVRAALTLFDAGLTVEAQPNARAALEHAAMLQALVRAQAVGDGEEFLHALDTMHRNRARDDVKRMVKLDASTGGQYADLVKAASEWLDRADEEARRARGKRKRKPGAGPRPNVGTVRALFDGLPGGGEGFHHVYGKLSEGAHAGLTSAKPYLSAKELGLKPTPVQWAEVLLTLVWACWAADDAMDEFLVDGHLAARHEPLTAPLGFVPGESRRGQAEEPPSP